MLNRLYIVIGVIAILVLAAAFIVPGLIPWGNYRGRMESLAGQALGANVRINGDIHFTLLPAPHLVLSDVAVGPQAQPVITVKSADADFTLMDFLRDRYSMTKLVLDHPVLDLTVKADGTVDTGLKPEEAGGPASVSVANARINVGTLRLTDSRSGQTYAVEGLDGDLTMGSINGPFGFSGGGSFGEQHYGVHLTSGALDKAGNAQLSLFARPDAGNFSVSADGVFATAGVPHFAGDLSYRQSPTGRSKDANGVVGDLTFASKIDGTPQKIVLGDFTLIPDENRAVARLTGNASIDLGRAPHFTATVASGVLALPPRDATTEQGPEPYELVRMLGELPVLPVPPIAGTVSASVDELDLRSFALRSVRLEAASDAKGWQLKQATGTLPGDTQVQLAGTLTAPEGRPSFAGTLSIVSQRLDGLASLWRKPAPDNPLFDMPGSFAAKVSLLGQTMALTDGQLVLDGTTHALTALINFGSARRIDVSGQFTDLSAADSAALLALGPDLTADPSAAVTFPQGAVALAANSAMILGLKGTGLALEGKWGDGQVELSKLAAEDLGGAKFDLSLALGGTVAAPRLAGDGTIDIAAAGPALDLVFDRLATPPAARAFLTRSLPVELKAHLDNPASDGSQSLSLSGRAGVADATLVAQLGGGLTGALASPLSASLELDASDPRGLTQQLGLGEVSVLPETGPVKLTASLKGTPTGPLQMSFKAAGGGDSIGFDGNITPGDLTAINGSGKLTLALSDSSVLATDAGLGGVYTPPVKGSADIRFAGGRSITADNVTGVSGATGFSGKLALEAGAKGGVVSGKLAVDSLDVAGLVAAAGGPTAMMGSSGTLWPDGPLGLGDAPRSTTGTVAIATPAVKLGGKPFVTDAAFDLDWDATGVGLHNLAGKLGGGTVALDVAVCCAGPAADKQMNGQASINGVALASVLPPAVAATLSGSLAGSARFSGTGDSISALAGGLTGDGSFVISDLGINKFNPGVFAEVAAVKDIVNLDPKDLSDKVTAGLDHGAFDSPKVGGGFTIAGGVLRIPNLAASTPAARLFGGATVKLADLGLGGSFALTPTGTLDAAGLVSETTSKVTANLSGTLPKPVRALDIATMVEAVKVKALENEVARLEVLKAQDDARAKDAANINKEATEDEQAEQLAEQQAQQLADEQAAKAAADATAKQAADAAAQQAADAAAQQAADAEAAQQAADAAAQQATDAAAAKQAADAAAAKQAAADAAAAKLAAADAAAAKQAAAKKAAQETAAKQAAQDAAAKQAAQTRPPPMDLQMPPAFQ